MPKYKIGQEVMLRNLGKKGEIRGISIGDDNSIEYRINYVGTDGIAHKTWKWESDLSPITTKKTWENLDKNVVERVANAIYDQMSYTENGVKPEWVVGGNSNKQEEARDIARSALFTHTITLAEAEKELGKKIV